MRDITIAVVVGSRVPPGADHHQKYDHYQMSPGTAWRLDPENGNTIVNVKDVSKAAYAWEMRWIDGRTVAVFDGPDGRQYAQPVTDDPRAKAERRRAVVERKPPLSPEQVPSPGAVEPTELVARDAPRRRKLPTRRKPLSLRPLKKNDD